MPSALSLSHQSKQCGVNAFIDARPGERPFSASTLAATVLASRVAFFAHIHTHTPKNTRFRTRDTVGPNHSRSPSLAFLSTSLLSLLSLSLSVTRLPPPIHSLSLFFSFLTRTPSFHSYCFPISPLALKFSLPLSSCVRRVPSHCTARAWSPAAA